VRTRTLDGGASWIPERDCSTEITGDASMRVAKLARGAFQLGFYDYARLERSVYRALVGDLE
jgi:hypothetical protein